MEKEKVAVVVRSREQCLKGLAVERRKERGEEGEGCLSIGCSTRCTTRPVSSIMVLEHPSEQTLSGDSTKATSGVLPGSQHETLSTTHVVTCNHIPSTREEILGRKYVDRALFPPVVPMITEVQGKLSSKRDVVNQPAGDLIKDEELSMLENRLKALIIEREVAVEIGQLLSPQSKSLTPTPTLKPRAASKLNLAAGSPKNLVGGDDNINNCLRHSSYDEDGVLEVEGPGREEKGEDPAVASLDEGRVGDRKAQKKSFLQGVFAKQLAKRSCKLKTEQIPDSLIMKATDSKSNRSGKFGFGSFFGKKRNGKSQKSRKNGKSRKGEKDEESGEKGDEEEKKESPGDGGSGGGKDDDDKKKDGEKAKEDEAEEEENEQVEGDSGEEEGEEEEDEKKAKKKEAVAVVKKDVDAKKEGEKSEEEEEEDGESEYSESSEDSSSNEEEEEEGYNLLTDPEFADLETKSQFPDDERDLAGSILDKPRAEFYDVLDTTLEIGTRDLAVERKLAKRKLIPKHPTGGWRWRPAKFLSEEIREPEADAEGSEAGEEDPDTQANQEIIWNLEFIDKEGGEISINVAAEESCVAEYETKTLEKKHHDFVKDSKIDVLDFFRSRHTGQRMKKWRQGVIVEQHAYWVRVHFVNWKSVWDEWLHVYMHEHRLSEFSKMTQRIQRRIKRRNMNFQKVLNRKRKLQLVEMEADGNCLFRTVAHQVYGTPSKYKRVREECCDYLFEHMDRFAMFMPNIRLHIRKMRRDREWGDDTEIRAMEEIYDRPFEIYSVAGLGINYKPMKIHFDGDLPKRIRKLKVAPIRLGYHGQCHYNSIVPIDLKMRGNKSFPPPPRLTTKYIMKHRERMLRKAEVADLKRKEESARKEKEEKEKKRKEEEEKEKEGKQEEEASKGDVGDMAESKKTDADTEAEAEAREETEAGTEIDADTEAKPEPEGISETVEAKEAASAPATVPKKEKSEKQKEATSKEKSGSVSTSASDKSSDNSPPPLNERPKAAPEEVKTPKPPVSRLSVESSPSSPGTKRMQKRRMSIREVRAKKAGKERMTKKKNQQAAKKNAPEKKAKKPKKANKTKKQKKGKETSVKANTTIKTKDGSMSL